MWDLKLKARTIKTPFVQPVLFNPGTSSSNWNDCLGWQVYENEGVIFEALPPNRSVEFYYLVIQPHPADGPS